jgi:Uma2 family endonuclease
MTAPTTIIYPDSDGLPMSDNTRQFEWIVTIKGNVDALFRNDPNVFVAGDLLWYPVEGDNKTRQAPDTLVAFGRPKGYRGSYRQWEEGGVAPQVVFEILSPGNRAGELLRKLDFYDRHGVEEYIIYDPDRIDLTGYLRRAGKLTLIDEMNGWVSPRLGVRFDMSGPELVIYRPDGQPFATFVELEQQREEARQQSDVDRRAREEALREADLDRRAREQAQQRADAADKRASEAEKRAEQLAAQLRERGIEPAG